jgi:YgiT-type zinc finger domain-containing protein
MKQVGKCPKCGGEMKSGKPSQDFRILKEGDLMGDGVEALYCQDCGFIELYKEPSTKEPKRWPKPLPEQEQPKQTTSVEEPRKPREREMDKRLIR